MEKAAPVFGAYNDGATDITEVTASTNFTVDNDELTVLKAVTEEGKHNVTISSNAEAGLAITIRVRVIDDDPSGLVKIPANIILSREINGNYATGEGQIGLYSDFTDLVAGTIEVKTNGRLYLTDVENSGEFLTVHIYKSDNLAYNGSEPLVSLTKNEPVDTFKLKTGNVNRLKGENYLGTMEFVIEYR